MSFASLITQWVTLHSLVVVCGLSTYAVMSHLLRQRRHPSAAIAWVISIVLFPYIAFPLYLLLGTRKLSSHRPKRLTHAPFIAVPHETSFDGKFQALAEALGAPPVSSYVRLGIHRDGGEALSSLMSVIQDASHSVDVCTFLLGGDALGQQVISALTKKSVQGVKVRLLIDGIGIYLGGKLDLKSLRAAGVQVQLFVSPWRSVLPGRTNLRNHRKMVIADGNRLWTGGRNLAAEYFLGDPASRPPKTAWTDLTLEVSGDLAEQAQAQFHQDWAFAAQLPHKGRRHVTNTEGRCLTASGRRAQWVPSGPDQVDDTVYALLISSCFSAQRRIMAVTPYFVPDTTLLMALTLAARRGVQVDLILPQQSNHRLADIARHAALRDLATAGAHIGMFAGMIHAKVVVIDEELALAGTANLDERSLFLNYELMIAFFDTSAVERFAAWIEAQKWLTTAYSPKSPGFLGELGEGLVRSVAFQL